jgi:hypothetical protein
MRTAWIAAALAALAAAGPRATPAQERVVIRGQVLAFEGRQPLRGVLVTAPLSGASVLTDSLGAFSFEMFTDLEYQLLAEDMGYLPHGVTVGQEAHEAPVLILLRADDAYLAGLATLEERLRQRRGSRGGRIQIIEHDSLMVSTEPSAYDLVRRSVPMARACEGRGEQLCIFGGSSERAIRLCIDDVRPTGGAGDLTRYEPAHLWRVEIYGNGSQVRVFTRWFVDRTVRSKEGRVSLTPMC